MRLTTDEGFTLIELLIVIVVIGILAAIAIPAFLNQRAQAANGAAVSDLRNLVAIETGILTEVGSFTDEPDEVADEGWAASSDVIVCALVQDSGGLLLASWHGTLGDTQYSWSSTTGTITAVEPAPTAGDDCEDAIATGAVEVS